MSLFESTFQKYILKINPGAKGAAKEDDFLKQQTLALSEDYWVQLNLIHNPKLHPIVQELFVNKFGSLSADEFVNTRNNFKQKLGMQNTLVLMNRLADHPNLDESLYGKITTAILRLDDEALMYLDGGESEKYMAEDILGGLRNSVRLIVSNLINNPAFTDMEIRAKLSNRFDISVKQFQMWSEVEAEEISTSMHDVWSTANVSEHSPVIDVYKPIRAIWSSNKE